VPLANRALGIERSIPRLQWDDVERVGAVRAVALDDVAGVDDRSSPSRGINNHPAEAVASMNALIRKVALRKAPALLRAAAGTIRGRSRLYPPEVSPPTKGLFMKKVLAIALLAGAASLSACNSSPREQAADNIEANADAVADNLEDAADNVDNDTAEDHLENKADAVRELGEKKADDMRTHDADTNLKNGI
jgi:hypothetical protein